MPILPNKGYSICRELFAKFKSEEAFLSKLNILYLVNDLLAYANKMFPGKCSIYLFSIGFLCCIQSYIELMLDDLHQHGQSSDNRINTLITIWEQHHLFLLIF